MFTLTSVLLISWLVLALLIIGAKLYDDISPFDAMPLVFSARSW